jgi:putative endonuclease
VDTTRAQPPVILSGGPKAQAKNLVDATRWRVCWKMKSYFIYIMANKSRTLYTGVTNDLMRRVHEHKQKLIPGFTRKYRIASLVHFEETSDIQSAIAREKQIKGWLRGKKVALIESFNPRWDDLSKEWFEDRDSSSPDDSSE